MSAQTTPEEVKRYREAELTHGRVSMLAALGFLAGEAVENIPLFMNWEGNISGMNRLSSTPSCQCTCTYRAVSYFRAAKHQRM